MADQFSRSLGKRIRAARKSKGLTQEQVAKSLDVSQPAVSGWEQGLTFPTLPALVTLAELLDTTVDELVGNDEHEPEAVAG